MQAETRFACARHRCQRRLASRRHLGGASCPRRGVGQRPTFRRM